MCFTGPARFFARAPRPSPAINAAPALTPVFLAFDIMANAAPALVPVRLRFDVEFRPS